MRDTWARGVSIVTLVGVMVLSVGMTDSASAAPPSKPPAPTGTATQNWDQNLPSGSRFTVLTDFGGAAVRDNNTGLVWEQAPDLTDRVWERALDPLGATQHCVNKTVGGTVGWRLPSAVELKSVMDPTLPAPFVPTNVFTGIQASYYFWSATTYTEDPSNAWYVLFSNGNVGSVNKLANSLHVWCVRGPMNADQY